MEPNYNMYEMSSVHHIGRIYEKYVPAEHRHNLGQYFTHPSLADFVNCFCIKNDSDKVLDPSCGLGIFLLRAYHRFKYLNPKKNTQKIIDQLWGVDIERLPAQLTAINVAKLFRKESEKIRNHPAIFCQNFFNLHPMTTFSVHDLDGVVREKSFPLFDAIVGNPPYTRQEEIRKELTGSKRKIATIIKENCKVDLPRRASLYAYFLVYSLRFLRKGGRLGFIIPSTWLNNEYSTRLQREILSNTRIIALVESQVERWFSNANVSTMIIILEKNLDYEENFHNSVKFVQLKKPIIQKGEEQRFNYFNKLVNHIESSNGYFENVNLRIFNVLQSKLWEKGFSTKGSKNKKNTWIKYLRAPKIYFTILEKAGSKLIRLGEIANISFSIKSGANKFFILTKEQILNEGIEDEFWNNKASTGQLIANKIICSLRETKAVKINVNRLTKHIILTNKTKRELKNTNFLKYVLKGEQRQLHKRRTCAAHRPEWYCLRPNPPAILLYAQRMGDRFLVPLVEKAIFVNKNLHSIIPNEAIDTQVLAAVLNSSITHLFHELNGRLLVGAQNVIDSDIRVVKSLQILDPRPILQDPELREQLVKAFEKYSSEKIEHSFKELGTNEPEMVNLMQIKPHKLALDTVLFDYIGLKSEDVKQVYAAIIERIASRKQKSENRKSKK